MYAFEVKFEDFISLLAQIVTSAGVVTYASETRDAGDGIHRVLIVCGRRTL